MSDKENINEGRVAVMDGRVATEINKGRVQVTNGRTVTQTQELTPQRPPAPTPTPIRENKD